MCNQLPVDLLRSMADEHEAQIAAARGPVVPYTPPKTDQGADRARKYGLAALAGIADTVASAPHGERHRTLYASARKVSVLVREGLITESEGRAALRSAAQGTDNERDIERTINDGIEKGRGDSADWLPDFDTPTIHNTPSDMQLSPPELVTAPRHYENGIPGGIRELLNNWHNNPWVHIEGNDVDRVDSLYTYLAIRHDLIYRGIVEPDAALSMHEVADLNRFGVSYKVLHALEQSELFTFLFPYKELNTTGKEKETITAGRPTTRYPLPELDTVWDRFFAYHRDQMFRALLVEKYRDLPVDLLTYDDVLLAMDELEADYDAIGAINDAIHDLLVEYDDRLREAQAELEWRIDTIRRKYIDTDPAPYSLAPGVTFTKPSQHKDLHLAITLQRDGGEIQDRYAAARAGGWTLPAYRAALKRAESLLGEAIVTVPNFTERGTITTDCESVTAACEAISLNGYMRGRIKLHAVNGEKVTVSPGYAKHFNYDEWLDDNGGSAEIEVWDHSIDKLERLETPTEAANRSEVSKRQKAINSRRDYDAEAEARAERETEPGKVDTWVREYQGRMVAAQLGVNPDDPQRWRAIFETVRSQEGAPMPTMTAHSEPRESTSSNDLLEVQPDKQNLGDPSFKTWGDPMSKTPPDSSIRIEKSNRGDPSLKPPPPAEKGTPAPAGAMCECCNQPAARQLMDGNYCADHAALDFPARYEAFKLYTRVYKPRPLVWAESEAAR